MRYQARAPLRIDFGGTWTDTPVYAEREGGAVFSAAITRYARGHISKPEISGALNTLRSDRSYVSYSIDVPAGAGLGASAAQTVLWLTLVKSVVSNVADRQDIARMAVTVADMLGNAAGVHDEYASALGGIRYFTFTGVVGSERLDLSSAELDALRSRLVLAFSGRRHAIAELRGRVWARYTSGDPTTTSALRAMKRLAGQMRDAVADLDLDALASFTNEHREHQKSLDAAVETPEISELIQLGLDNGAAAARVTGEGGGGCVLFITRPGEAGSLTAALRRTRVQMLDFDFDTYGVFLKKA